MQSCRKDSDDNPFVGLDGAEIEDLGVGSFREPEDQVQYLLAETEGLAGH